MTAPNVSTIRVGDVVQIDPANDERFGGCFLVVEEVKAWGVIGYVRMPGTLTTVAPLRVEFAQLHRIGHATWVQAP